MLCKKKKNSRETITMCATPPKIHTRKYVCCGLFFFLFLRRSRKKKYDKFRQGRLRSFVYYLFTVTLGTFSEKAD